MQNSQNKKSLQIVLVVLIAVLTLGIGYASITAINLIISGNATASASQENFKVKFLKEENVTPVITSNDGGTGDIDVTSDTTATFNISGLDAAGESATANYVVKNVSEGIGAKITIKLTSTNTEYFKVTTTVVDDTLQAGEETDVRVKVEMLKTPIDTAVTTTVTATLTATPMENAEASGGETVEEVRPAPPQYLYSLHNYGDPYVNINMDVSSVTRTFNSFAAAKAEFGHPASLALIVEDNKVKESYVAFEYENKVYYLRGGVNEEELDEKPIFNSNLEILNQTIGSSYKSQCSQYTDWIQCTYDNNLHFDIGSWGKVYINGDNWYCVADYRASDQYDFAGCRSY